MNVCFRFPEQGMSKTFKKTTLGTSPLPSFLGRACGDVSPAQAGVGRRAPTSGERETRGKKGVCLCSVWKRGTVVFENGGSVPAPQKSGLPSLPDGSVWRDGACASSPSNFKLNQALHMLDSLFLLPSAPARAPTQDACLSSSPTARGILLRTLKKNENWLFIRTFETKVVSNPGLVSFNPYAWESTLWSCEGLTLYTTCLLQCELGRF